MAFKKQTMVMMLSVCSIMVLATAPAPAQENPGTDQATAEAPEANQAYFPHRFFGGEAYAKSFAHSDQFQRFTDSYRRGYNFRPLRDGYVDVFVPRGATHLVNVAFSAECRLIDRDKDKYKKFNDSDSLLIRVSIERRRPNGSYGDTVYLNDRDQSFCSDDGYATHKGNWGYLLSGQRDHGTYYRVRVAFLVFDKFRNDKLIGWIDDWTLEAISYVSGRRTY